MAPIYSTRFIASHAGAAASYTVPAGQKAVVRSITVCNLAASAQQWWRLYHSPSACYIALGLLAPPPSSPGPDYLSIDVRFVMTGGESITVQNDAGIDMTVSGYLFAN